MKSLLKTLAVILWAGFGCNSAQAQTKQMLWPEGELPISKGLAIEENVQNDRLLNKIHIHGGISSC